MSKRLEDFFIVCPPEITDELEQELEGVWPFLLDETGRPSLQPLVKMKVLGGLYLKTELVFGFQLNRVLKLASRILWRRASFKARELFQIESQLKSLAWSDWVSPGQKIKFTVSASGSKVNNEKRIEDMLSRLLNKKFKLVSDNEDRHFYLRHHENQMTVSLDTSGEHLHKRGVVTLKGEAPLRETLAACGLRWMMNDLAANEIKGLTWLDPMAGSGTHGSELLDYNRLGPRTRFAFQSFQEVPKILLSPLFWQNHILAQGMFFKNLIMADQNEEAFQGMKKNLESTAAEGVLLFKKDLFLSDGRDDYGISQKDRLFVIVNPPYGERLQLQEPRRELEKIHEHIWSRLLPERLGMWLPASVGDIRGSGRVMLKKNLKNGGLAVKFLVWEREV